MTILTPIRHPSDRLVELSVEDADVVETTINPEHLEVVVDANPNPNPLFFQA